MYDYAYSNMPPVCLAFGTSLTLHPARSCHALSLQQFKLPSVDKPYQYTVSTTYGNPTYLVCHQSSVRSRYLFRFMFSRYYISHVTDAARRFSDCVFRCLQQQTVRMSAEAPLDRAQFLAASAAVATSSVMLPLVALAEDEEVRTLDGNSSSPTRKVAHTKQIRIYNQSSTSCVFHCEMVCKSRVIHIPPDKRDLRRADHTYHGNVCPERSSSSNGISSVLYMCER